MGFRKRDRESQQDVAVATEEVTLGSPIRVESATTWGVLMKSSDAPMGKLYTYSSQHVAEAAFIVDHSKYPILRPRLVRATVTYEVFDE